MVAFCNAGELRRLEAENPFASRPPSKDLVQFVSILSKAVRHKPPLPIDIPRSGEPFVRITGSKGRLVFGTYRRHMRTIACLGQIDELFGAAATTRSWSTIVSILRILNATNR
jgi:hypothetical protein